MEQRPASPPAALPCAGRNGVLCWLYLLVLVPLSTDLVETGRLPHSLREWLTELVAGAVIAALVAKVRREHLAALELVRTDGLTGIRNRRAFDEAIAAECARARRTRQPLSLVCIDIDHFKQINDREGHARGDQVLRQLAAAIDRAVRAGVDGALRIGGDEFALLLPGSTTAQTGAVLQRIRELCDRSDAAWAAGRFALSAGIAEFDPAESSAALLRRADQAMYRHKAAQRA